MASREALPALLTRSPYLHGLSRRYPALLSQAPETGWEAVLSEAAAALAAAQTTPAVMAALRRAKQQAALVAGHADLAGLWDDRTVMQRLSGFADMAVRAALRHLLAAAQREKTARLPDARDLEKDCGVCIVALGKWGAHELNYSSDIDLMVIFDPRRSPAAKKDETQNFFIRLTRDLARMLEETTAEGYVFRCDLRLRPDPGAMPLAVSIDTAETYYGSLGQNWERAAMIKARPVAGDARLGADFQRLMAAWIWRRNLDFAAIQDIHSIKRQINAKNGRPRGGKAPANPYLGVNVKLGHGGIREIEFFAQTQQLIFGGRDVTLRAPATLDALDALAAAGHIAAAARDRLAEAYLFLRRTEHRLQMMEDRQTHSLPAAPGDFAAAAAFMGYADPAGLAADLDRHMGAVKKLYAALFTEAESLSAPGNLVFTGVEDDPETLETLRGMGFCNPATVTAAIRGWHHGRYRAVRSERARQILTEITPRLLETLGKTAHPDDAFVRFDRFLEKLPSGIPIFSMFARNPRQLGLVADIMGTAPALADWLGTHPQVLDGVLSRDFFNRLPGLDYLKDQLSHLLAAARDYQDVLDLTRRFAREKRFHAGMHILQNLSPPADCARYLSDIAEAALTVLLPHVEKEFARQHGGFKTGELMILAMGSFAARAMFTDSDLDIVGIYRHDPAERKSDGKKPLAPSVYYIRLMQRLITALSAPTSESILYPVDTRLRPGGSDGPLAVSLEGFFDYQRKQAWTWEHMCLIRARLVYARPATRRLFAREARKILRRPRGVEKLRADIRDMQKKVQAQFGAKDPWQMKYRPGGIMDMMFALHFLILRKPAGKTDIYQPNFMAAVAALKKDRRIGAAEAALLGKALETAVAVQGFLRLTAELPFAPGKSAAALKDRLAQSLSGPARRGRKKTSFAEAQKSMNALFKKTDALCKALLAPPPAKGKSKTKRKTKA